MSDNLDCYFFKAESEENTMDAWCTDCRNKKRPHSGWFWHGSVKGYGPWDIKCHECNKFIHRVNKDDKPKKSRKKGNSSSSI
jgi:hypothetical protein